MITTGIDSLDRRLGGGLSAGGTWVVSGRSGAGKTSLALQLLGAALEEGMEVLLLTQENPRALAAQAALLGRDLRGPEEEGRLVLLRCGSGVGHKLARAGAPDRIVNELLDLLGDRRPTFLVVDTILPFVRGEAPGPLLAEALLKILDAIGGTQVLVVRGELGDHPYWELHDRLAERTSGILHLEIERGAHRLHVRRLRDGPGESGSVPLALRPGSGLVGSTGTETGGSPPGGPLRRVILVERGPKLPSELRRGLEARYDLESHGVNGRSVACLGREEYGAAVITTDPLRPEAALDLVRGLRWAGVGAPLLLASPQPKLRACDRRRGLRAGADDFLTFDMHRPEFLQRVETARSRGHRSMVRTWADDPGARQPTDDDGNPLPLDEARFRDALGRRILGSDHPFFSFARLSPPEFERGHTLDLLLGSLRLGEGDLVARADDGEILICLEGVGRDEACRLLERFGKGCSDPAGLPSADVIEYPAQRLRIERWVEGGKASTKRETAR